MVPGLVFCFCRYSTFIPFYTLLWYCAWTSLSYFHWALYSISHVLAYRTTTPWLPFFITPFAVNPWHLSTRKCQWGSRFWDVGITTPGTNSHSMFRVTWSTHLAYTNADLFKLRCAFLGGRGGMRHELMPKIVHFIPSWSHNTHGHIFRCSVTYTLRIPLSPMSTANKFSLFCLEIIEKRWLSTSPLPR